MVDIFSNSQLTQLARQHGTPLYVYSEVQIRQNYNALAQACKELRPQICYAVKANGNLSILQLIAALGGGFDIVSEGELHRVLVAGGDAQKVVFSGVGKTRSEIACALERGIRFFNAESAAEIEVIEAVATEKGRRAPLSLRLNPNINPKTHKYLSTGIHSSKFGIPLAEAREILPRILSSKALQLVALDCHIGSQLTELAPLEEAYRELLQIANEFRQAGAPVDCLDVGGGIGISYSGNVEPFSFADYGAMITRVFKGTPYAIVLEPGRSIVGDAGVLLTEVLYLKKNGERSFVVVDAGMNDLIRPSLYEAYHRIDLVSRQGKGNAPIDIVGPVCESGCYFAKQRAMPELQHGDLLAIRDAGAYGMAMASEYNARRLPAEILIEENGHARVIRNRESYEDLWRAELTGLGASK
jgi:diaminopimelate decarboxylase